MKTLKKLSFVLAILLALGCVAPMTAMAEVPYPDTIGYSEANVVKIDTTGLPNITTLADNATPSSGKYLISNADGLHKLSAIVNNGGTCAGVTFVQTADIDMETSGKTWTPIGSWDGDNNTSKDFRGTYDGQGFTISNLKYEVTEALTSKNAIGLLFVYGRAAITIKNVVLDSTCEVSYTHRTAVSAPMASILAVSGASGWSISNCYSAAKVLNADTNNESATSGILGYVIQIHGSNREVEYCTFAGTAQGVRRVGGIVGWIQNTQGSILNCLNIGTVSSTASTTADTNTVGGIIGAPNNTASYVCNIDNCENYGNISSNGTPNVGGIIGLVREGVTAHGNTDYGMVTITGKDTPTYIYGAVMSGKNADGVDGTNKVLRDADKAMFHGYQVRANGENAVDLRLVASIDSKSYSAVGMKVTVTFTYNGNPVTKVLDNEAGSKTTTVYETLTAYANDTNVDYTADALRIDEKSGYLYAVVLTGIPKAAFDSGDFTVTVTPYATDLENAETEYMGVQAVKVITLDPLPDNTVPEN
ncbi:MAG: hypothetical protein IJV73_06160 [Clostridia bacterium]|nr:hypothetical protein [Clostridia bacterium]